MNNFPVFLDAIRVEATGKLIELGSGNTESEALLPMLNAVHDSLGDSMPEHAVYINTGAVVMSDDLLNYLVLTSPLASALFKLGRDAEKLNRKREIEMRRRGA